MLQINLVLLFVLLGFLCVCLCLHVIYLFISCRFYIWPFHVNNKNYYYYYYYYCYYWWMLWRRISSRAFKCCKKNFFKNNVFEVSQVSVSMLSKIQLSFVKLSPQVSSKNLVTDIILFRTCRMQRNATQRNAHMPPLCNSAFKSKSKVL